MRWTSISKCIPFRFILSFLFFCECEFVVCWKTVVIRGAIKHIFSISGGLSDWNEMLLLHLPHLPVVIYFIQTFELIKLAKSEWIRVEWEINMAENGNHINSIFVHSFFHLYVTPFTTIKKKLVCVCCQQDGAVQSSVEILRLSRKILLRHILA